MPRISANNDTVSFLDKTATLLIRIIIIFVPFYAFISVWASSAVGHFTGVRLWDDYILLILVLTCSFYLMHSMKTVKYLLNDWLIRIILAYILLTILLGIVGYLDHNVSTKALFYGLLVNLRYLIWFVCVWMLATKTKVLGQRPYIFILLPFALIVLFGLLQFFVLPHNFLSHFGYGNNTYPQFITLNQNSPTIRIQSFLRGANPLGAYLAAVMCIVLACITRNRKRLIFWILLAASGLALYLTFSRSSLLGLLAGALVIVFLQIKNKKLQIIFVSILVALGIILGIGYQATKNNQAIQDVLFHHNGHSTALVTSNQGHLRAFKNNIKDAIHQPLGKGPGTSGQASYYNVGHQMRNTEDYFIQISEEVGWLGILLFLSILVIVAYRLWLKRDDVLGLGLLGGLIAISVISLFSYTWSDDTLAFLWWGLAGIALAPALGIKTAKKTQK